ncbi:MAG TPA: hypothetical protein VJJ47_02760 [Candidatus Paceibacterota bacterium]
MKMFGNYVPEILKGVPQIEPLAFVACNWDDVCRLAKLDSPPPICVPCLGKKILPILGTGENVFFLAEQQTGGLGIFVNAEKLEENFLAGIMERRPMPYIWGLMAAMARSAAAQLGAIAPEDLLTAGHVRAALQPFGEELQNRCMEMFLHGTGESPGDHSCVQYLVQLSLLAYRLDDFDEHLLARVLQAKARSFDLLIDPPR